MYTNLIIEMKRNKVTVADVAKVLGVHRNTVNYKLLGDKGDLKMQEAQRIQKKLFPDLDLDYLFKWDNQEREVV